MEINLKKKLLFLGMIMLIMFFVVGCLEGEEYQGEYFTFKYPEGWQIEEEATNTNIKSVVVAPDNEVEDAIFSVEVDFSGANLAKEDYTYTQEDFRREVEQEFKDLKDLAEFTGAIEILADEKLEIDEQPAYRLVFAEGDIIYNTTLVYKNNSNSVLMYAAKKSFYEDNLEEAELIEESFEFNF